MASRLSEVEARFSQRDGQEQGLSEVDKPKRAPRTHRAGAGLILVVLLVVAIGALALWRSFQAAAPPGIIVASGRIEGRITLLTPKSMGRVISIEAEEGQTVVAGQILAALDDEAQRERIRAAEENLSALSQRLRAADMQLAMLRHQVALQIDQATAALGEAQAQLAKTRANLAQARREAERFADLARKNYVATQDAERARLQAVIEEHALREVGERKTRAEKQLALAQLGLQQIDIQSAERDALASQAAQARAALAEQQSYARDFVIRSPLHGTILTRTVELGEYVNAGVPLFTLVDLDQLYMKVYIPEPQIGLISLEQEARVYVNAYPGRAFPARVSRVAQQAEFTPKNVETKEERVKLVFAVELALEENPGGVLKPGMPADALIRWQPDAPWSAP